MLPSKLKYALRSFAAQGSISARTLLSFALPISLASIGLAQQGPTASQAAPPSTNRTRGFLITPPRGDTLALGDTCYTLTTKIGETEAPIGAVFQSIHRDRSNGRDTLSIVVHQHVEKSGPKPEFDMRDSFLLRTSDLRPIRLDTDRNGTPHVHLDYTETRVTGWKIVKGTRQPIDITFNGPVWDGNLWGPTFAALPLEAGGHYQLPVYQYDTGQGSFFVNVTGTHAITTPRGPIQALALNAGLKLDELVPYFIAPSPRAELGYTAGPTSQRPGSTCTGLH